jgi:surface antigen
VRKYLAMVAAALITCGMVASLTQADENDEKIKAVMNEALKKGGLCQKVGSGKASEDEKKKLLELFQSLASATPPKGDAESWKTKTTALVEAAQAVLDGKAEAKAMLKDAANCKACHSVHRTKAK